MSVVRKLTEAERRVLELADFTGGRKPVADDDIPARNEKDLWGDMVPGRRIWKAMVSAGLVLLPVEDPVRLEDGSEFTFTAFYELTDLGRAALRDGMLREASKPSPALKMRADRALDQVFE